MRSSQRRPSPPRAPKARGELAEARFIAKALSLGLFVSKPFGDSLPYDFIVETGGKLSRVQVKSAWCATPRGAFQFVASPIQNRGHQAHPYRGHEIDFFVAYINPVDTWFVIPVRALRQHNHLHLSLEPSHAFARYREAWHLLEQLTIHAAAGYFRLVPAGLVPSLRDDSGGCRDVSPQSGRNMVAPGGSPGTAQRRL